MKKVVFLTTVFFSALFISSVFAVTDNVEKMSAESFLKRLQSSYNVGLWADMRGVIKHKRRLKNGKYESSKAKVKVAVLYTKLQAVAMIKINENDINDSMSEVYKVGQPYNGDNASIIASNLQDKSMIGNFGIDPGDFAMTFLFWDLKKRVAQDQTGSVKGLKCRILNLENPNTKESVRIFASIEYFCPLKVEWFKDDNNKAYRSMTIESFKVEGNLGVPNDFLITGPGWKTKVSFDDVKIGNKNFDIKKTDKKSEPIPKNLFE